MKVGMLLHEARNRIINWRICHALIFLIVGLFLLGKVSAVEASTLDQFYSGIPDSYSNLRDTTNNILIAQGITVGSSGSLSSVKLNLQKNGNPTGNISVGIYTDYYGSPYYAVASSNNVAASSVINGLNEFIFTNPYYVSLGQKFWIVLNGDYPISQTDNIGISYSFQSPNYQGGIRGYFNNLGGWNLFSSGDFNFETYVNIPVTPTPTSTPTPTATPTPTEVPTLTTTPTPTPTNGTLDQFYNGTPESYSSLRDITNNMSIAQQITVGLTGNLSSVKLNLQKNGNPTGYISVSLYNDYYNSPWQAYVTSRSISVSSVINGFNEFIFTNPYPVSQGQKWWIVLSGDYPYSMTDNISISYSTESPVYSGGIRGYLNNVGGQNLFSNGDFNFETYVVPTPTPLNQAPILNPIGNKTINEGQLLQFTISATDPDGDNLIYSASNLPPGATFDPQTATFSWTPDFSQEGNYPDIEFTVTDDGTPIELDTELITITVGNINRSPVFDPIGSKEVLENELLTFMVSATDPDGNGITLSAANLPIGASFDPQTKVFSWTPTLSQAGNYVFTLNSKDDGTPNQTGTIDVAITVGDNPTLTEEAENLINIVVSYNFPTNVENSYLANLKKVGKFIDEGKIEAATNQLNAFITKVEEDYSVGIITQSERDNLVGLAQALLQDLQ